MPETTTQPESRADVRSTRLLAALNDADSELSAYAHHRPLSKLTAQAVSLDCRDAHKYAKELLEWLGEIRSLVLEIESDSFTLPPQHNRIVNDVQRIVSILDGIGVTDAKPKRGTPANRESSDRREVTIPCSETK